MYASKARQPIKSSSITGDQVSAVASPLARLLILGTHWPPTLLLLRWLNLRGRWLLSWDGTIAMVSKSIAAVMSKGYCVERMAVEADEIDVELIWAGAIVIEVEETD